MSVPYTFANTPNGTKIPLSHLDADFAYIDNQTSSLVANLPIKVIDTIADLRSFSVNATLNVQVNGYYTNGDGGDGYFYPVTGAAPGTYIDNGGTIIVPTGGDGSSAWVRITSNDLINVLWFGAKGDGSTDNTTYIQNALDTGYSIFIPKGNFLVNSTLTIDIFGQSIFGTGYGSQLILDDASVGISLTGASISGDLEDTQICNLHIKSNNSTVSLLRYIACPAMLSVRNVYFEGGSVHILTTSSVSSQGTYGLHCSQCVFYAAADYGIWVNPVSSSYSQAHFINDCEFFGNKRHLWVSGSNGVFVHHSRFERKAISATHGPAIHFDGGSNFIVRDCYLEDNNDIKFIEIGYAVSGVTIDGNVFSLNNQADVTNFTNIEAVYVNSAGNTNITVTNNQINMYSGASPVSKIIDFNNATNILCINNALYGSGASGVSTGITSSCASFAADFSQNRYIGTFASKATQRNQVSWSKAWACYNGSSGTLLDGFAISGVTKNSAGDYTFTLSNAMANNAYVVVATASSVANSSSLYCFPVIYSKTTTQFRIKIFPSGSGAGPLADVSDLNVCVFGSVYA